MSNTLKSRSLTKRKKDIIFVACLSILPMLQYFIFYICVNFNSLIMAFQSYEVDALTGLGAYEFGIGVGNFTALFKKLISEGIIGICLKNSLLFYGFNTLIGTSLALFFAYYIARGNFMGGFFKVILFLPSIISSIVIIQLFMSVTENVIPFFYQKLTGEAILGPMSRVETKQGVLIFYNIWVGFGSGILLYSGAMKNISESVVEAAKIDGTTEIKEFFYIILPLIYPTLKTFLIAGLTGLFTSDMCLFSFQNTNADKILWTFGYYMIKETRLATLAGLPQLSAFGIVLTLVAVPLTFGARYLLNKLDPMVD